VGMEARSMLIAWKAKMRLPDREPTDSQPGGRQGKMTVPEAENRGAGLPEKGAARRASTTGKLQIRVVTGGGRGARSARTRGAKERVEGTGQTVSGHFKANSGKVAGE